MSECDPPAGAGFDWSATYDMLVVACVHAADAAALGLRARLARRSTGAQRAAAGHGSAEPEPGAALWEDVLTAWRAYKRWATQVVAVSERLAECAGPLT